MAHERDYNYQKWYKNLEVINSVIRVIGVIRDSDRKIRLNSYPKMDNIDN